MELLCEGYELASLINDCYTIVASNCKKKNLDLYMEIDENLPSILYGDDVRIRQIVNNFLSNAVKYTKRGHVILKISYSRIDEENINLRIDVKDSGIGIQKKDMENLFQNFTRLEEYKNRNIEGTGLGLSLTKRLVDMMHGEVQVESQYGEGSTFTAIIPQKVICEDGIGDMKQIFENYELSVGAMMPVPQFAGVHILVVDDMEMNRIVAKEMLLQTGAIVDVAGSGEEGLTLMKEQHYDLIFMDQMMPDMDGIATFEEMKRMNHQNKTTPVIAMTANAVKEQRKCICSMDLPIIFPNRFLKRRCGRYWNVFWQTSRQRQWKRKILTVEQMKIRNHCRSVFRILIRSRECPYAWEMKRFILRY